MAINRNLATGLIILAGCSACTTRYAADGGYVCKPGVWDVSAWGKSPDGQAYTSNATSTRYCLYDGALELDEYRALGSDGSLVFIGASFHYWSVDERNVNTLWVMGGDPGYTILDGRLDGERLVTTGIGFDSGGEFLERSIHTYSGERNYQFDMDRSYDGGATWIDGFSMSEATFRTAETPPLPTELHPDVRYAKEVAGIQAPGTPVLDGYAEIEEIMKTKDGEAIRVLRFSSRYRFAGPDRWRSILWKLGAESIDEVETMIGTAGSQ